MSARLIDLREVFCVHRTDEGDAAPLQGMTISVAPGEIVCVLGPSGAGKSTLLRVIAALQPPSAGEVTVLGRDVGRLGRRGRDRWRAEHVGFLGQHAHAMLAPELRIEQAVGLPLALRGERREGRRARVAELLEVAGLAGRGSALPGELSGGERQRVALCAALAHRPELLLADEPTGELDSASAGSMLGLIVELARAQGTTVVVVSHDDATEAIADRTVKIRDGRLVEDGRDGLVLGPDGWLQLPGGLLEQAGISYQVIPQAVEGGLLLRPAGVRRSSAPDPARPPEPEPATWRPAAIELQAIGRHRGHGAGRRTVLHQLTVSFRPGALTAVTGRSGAGKTTLLRLLAGLDRPDAGDVQIDGQRLAGCDAEQLATLRRERIGYLPQEPSPVEFLSARENVTLSLRIRGWDAEAAAARASVSLSGVGLADRARQRVGRLSAGEAQRVALARALACARGLLIVDEPTSRLDRANAGVVAELLSTAAAHDGQTVVCATHDPELLRRADHVVALD